MQVTLKVVGGKHNGREIKVVGSKFTIGRAEGADLRPTSDLISRNHCGIFIEKGEVVVEDFGSRNGTFINGCLLYTSPSPRDKRQSRMPSSA